MTNGVLSTATFLLFHVISNGKAGEIFLFHPEVLGSQDFSLRFEVNVDPE